MFDGIFASLYSSTLTSSLFLAVSAVSIILGLVIALVYRNITGESGTMFTTLSSLPFLVQLVILLVNGNLGAGVAVAGAFSLVRFRSAPGTARDIMVIFLAMTVGLCCGMGYCTLAFLCTLVTCCILLFQRQKTGSEDRDLHVTIPENIDYSDLFTDLFATYTKASQLLRVKTVNMGSLYSLHYRVKLKDVKQEKELLDAMRCRNGNLEISCALALKEREEDIL